MKVVLTTTSSNWKKMALFQLKHLLQSIFAVKVLYKEKQKEILKAAMVNFIQNK